MPDYTPSRAIPQKQIMAAALAAVPTSATDLTTADSVVFQVTLANTTGSPINFTLLDKNTAPLGLFTATPVAANQTIAFNFDDGVPMKGGLRWSASGAGLNAHIVGGQKGF